MVKEFALEPDVLASSFREFTYFTEKFSVAQGRVISRFPRDWKRLVYAAAQTRLAGTTELARIEVRLRELADDVLVAFGRPGGDTSKPWLDRAVIEHARQAFSAIIAGSVVLQRFCCSCLRCRPKLGRITSWRGFKGWWASSFSTSCKRPVASI